MYLLDKMIVMLDKWSFHCLNTMFFHKNQFFHFQLGGAYPYGYKTATGGDSTTTRWSCC